ncbi:MAG TPA: hypothetical protein PKK15_18440 [Kouleothrix sp.]|uniref:hypothetical protein n=1 Tax=Kouleothrix sp. TaxID=2779161 RepID=UPI002CB445D0|nr:hypothetical protein [Kouleothrix sp.]
MRFPQSDKLGLTCVFEGLVPGQLHPDGRRYLPLIVLRPAGAPAPIGVVDRHHRVDPALEGREGVAKLVFLLSSVRLQEGRPRQGLAAEEGLAPGRASTVPTAYGRVLAVPAWEAEREHLPYEALYTELLLDIGVGVIGVRTSVTAASLAETIGKSQLEPGDWIEVRRSRIDILSFAT